MYRQPKLRRLSQRPPLANTQTFLILRSGRRPRREGRTALQQPYPNRSPSNAPELRHPSRYLKNAVAPAG
jgi:hypothetical protein